MWRNLSHTGFKIFIVIYIILLFFCMRILFSLNKQLDSHRYYITYKNMFSAISSVVISKNEDLESDKNLVVVLYPGLKLVKVYKLKDKYAPSDVNSYILVIKPIKSDEEK